METMAMGVLVGYSRLQAEGPSLDGYEWEGRASEHVQSRGGTKLGLEILTIAIHHLSIQ